MTETATSFLPSDLRGAGRLAADATAALTTLIENLHRNIAGTPRVFTEPAGPTRWNDGRATGITGLVYGGVRTAAGLGGRALDRGLREIEELATGGDVPPNVSPRRDGFLAALNGVLGDHLDATANPLAIPMRLRRDGVPLAIERNALDAAIPDAGSRVLVLAHGLCMNDRQWNRRGHDHGAALARDLGYTPLYLHYNSGLHVSENGRMLAELLERLRSEWPRPLESLTLVGHSLGGLVIRSACHHAQESGLAWRETLTDIVFIATPHHGAVLERGGNRFQAFAGRTPYTAPFARLGWIRSAGVTDLRHGNVLASDWAGAGRFDHHHDTRTHVPLPDGVRCFAIAGSHGFAPKDTVDRVVGDGLVHRWSALGKHRKSECALAFPAEHQAEFFDSTHWDLLSRRDVYEQIASWLGGDQSRGL
jgi:hypothetical protein